MLWNFRDLETCHRGNNPSSEWFQQDGATAHTARVLMSVLQEMFQQHVISHGSDDPWPAHSPDLSTCEYFLWWYLKGKVLISKPRTTEELKPRVKEEIAAIPEQMTGLERENHRERMEQCFRNGGRHLNNEIFKTYNGMYRVL
jgi:hypothetical protein